MLLAAALGYLRVRAGARGVLAILIGIAGVVVGLVEAGYYTVTVGPSGDDFSGLAAGAAGVVLLGLAVLVLWRSRKVGGSRKRRFGRRIALGLVGAAFAAEILFPFALGYVSNHVHTAGVPDAHLGAPYEDVSFTTTEAWRSGPGTSRHRTARP